MESLWWRNILASCCLDKELLFNFQFYLIKLRLTQIILRRWYRLLNKELSWSEICSLKNYAKDMFWNLKKFPKVSCLAMSFLHLKIFTMFFRNRTKLRPMIVWSFKLPTVYLKILGEDIAIMKVSLIKCKAKLMKALVYGICLSVLMRLNRKNAGDKTHFILVSLKNKLI